MNVFYNSGVISLRKICRRPLSDVKASKIARTEYRVRLEMLILVLVTSNKVNPIEVDELKCFSCEF